MAQDEIHVGDVGTVFEITVQDGGSVIDISSATTKDIIFEKPDRTNLTKTGSFTTDGTDGKIRYTTAADDLDAVGVWQIQAKIVMPSGTWHTNIGEFRVHRNL